MKHLIALLVSFVVLVQIAGCGSPSRSQFVGLWVMDIDATYARLISAADVAEKGGDMASATEMRARAKDLSGLAAKGLPTLDLKDDGTITAADPESKQPVKGSWIFHEGKVNITLLRPSGKPEDPLTAMVEGGKLMVTAAPKGGLAFTVAFKRK